MTTLLLNDLDIVFFFYGLAFVALGLVIFSQMRGIKRSGFRLVTALPYLAWFALIHGGHEILVMFSLIKGASPVVRILSTSLLAVSYIFLLFFGYTLVNLSKRVRLGAWFMVVVLLCFLGFPILLQANSLNAWIISSRYFPGLIGGILASVGILLYYQAESEKLDEMNVKRYLFAASAFFAVYAFAGGLIVPAANIFPASVMNEAAFLTLLGVPIQIFRAIAAVGLAWSFWKILNIFNLEQLKNHQEATDQLRRSHDELEMRVDQRTSELLETNALMNDEIAERKQAEAEAINLAKFPSENPSPVLRIRADGTVLFANAAGLPLLDDWGTQIGGRVDDRWQRLAVRILNANTPEKGIEVAHRGRLFSFTGAPVPEAGYINLYGSDVTERNQTEMKRHEAKELSDAINEINVLLSSTLDFEDIISTVMSESVRAIGCEACLVHMRDETAWVLSYGFNVPQGQLGRPVSPMEADNLEDATKNGTVLAVHDISSSPGTNYGWLTRFGAQSFVAMPLSARGSVIGMMSFCVYSQPTNFSEAQIDFAAKLAQSMSLALENARLYAVQRTIADTLQETLLTVPGRIEGIEFGHVYSSTSKESGTAGGDFYDLFELEHDRVGITIGDVSGKGLEAATLTSLVKNTIQAYAYQHNSPANVMAMTNDIVFRSSAAQLFVTAFFGILDKRSGTLRYCSAGHPPGMIRGKSSEITLLRTGSPAIGIFPNLEYECEEVALGAGDTLLLYTDGVIEAKFDRELYSEDRLIGLINSLENMQTRDIPGMIFADIWDFSKGTLEDDVAIVTISLEQTSDSPIRAVAAQTASQFSHAQTQDDLLAVLAEELTESTGASSTAIMLVDRENEHLHGVIIKPDEFAPNFSKIAVSLDGPFCGAVALKNGSPMMIEDASTDERAQSWLLRYLRVKSVLVLPLMVDDNARGVISIIEANHFREFTDDAIETAQAVVARAAARLSELEERQDLSA